MLRKLMLYLMVLATAVKFASLAYVFTTDIERLPVAVYVSTGIVVLFGLFLICKNIVKRVGRKELASYYGLSAAAVFFNLIFMKIFSRAEIATLDLLILGTMMDILVGVVFVVLTVREHKYVRRTSTRPCGRRRSCGRRS